MEPLNDSFDIPSDVQAIADVIDKAGGRCVVIGGAVRDALLGLSPKDFDVEVYGIPATDLRELLKAHFKVWTVGAAFGVLKVFVSDQNPEGIDVALPRSENKIGLGHKGFEVLSDPNMDPKQAARRRDLTINAIGRDVVTGELIDFYDGYGDLQRGVLRAVDDSKFIEDPLRVLRVMQFAARFGFVVADTLLATCASLDLAELPAERVGDEWRKLLLKSSTPSIGLRFLLACGQMQHFPRLHNAMKSQGIETVFSRVDRAASLSDQEGLDADERQVLVLSVLCCGMACKPRGRQPRDNKGVAAFLARLASPFRVTDPVISLVAAHNSGCTVPGTDSELRHCAHTLQPATVRQALRFLETTGQAFDRAERTARAEDLGVADEAAAPILLGRHLIAQGLKPSPQFKITLTRAYHAQLDGLFADEAGALEWLRTNRTTD